MSQAQGLGFLGAGSDVTDLKRGLQVAADIVAPTPLPGSCSDSLPTGMGFFNRVIEMETELEALREQIPAAVWFLAPSLNEDLVEWTGKIREVSRGKQIYGYRFMPSRM